MNLELFDHELKMLYQALGYAVVSAHTESETAEFAMLQLKVHNEILKQEQLTPQQLAKAETEFLEDNLIWTDSEHYFLRDYIRKMKSKKQEPNTF